jgi:hypothetical protein
MAGRWSRRASPKLAAKLAEQAGKVSHDGESVYAAMLLGGDGGGGLRFSSDIDHLSMSASRQIPGQA